MRSEDFVTVNDVVGYVRYLNLLTVSCQDGKERVLQAETHTIIIGQHYALFLAKKALRKIENINM